MFKRTYRIRMIDKGQFYTWVAEKKLPLLPIWTKLTYLYKSEFEDLPPWDSCYFLTYDDAQNAIESDRYQRNFNQGSSVCVKM